MNLKQHFPYRVSPTLATSLPIAGKVVVYLGAYRSEYTPHLTAHVAIMLPDGGLGEGYYVPASSLIPISR